MKKLSTLSLILFIPAMVLLMAYTNGPPAGNTGSPIDGQDCSDCHMPGPAISVSGWIISNIPMEGYTPGTTYTIMLTAETITAAKYGFQITAETTAAKAGSWVITDETRTQLSGTNAVSQTAAGTSPMGTPNSWTMDWTAPASGTGTVTFYAAVNKTNNNGSNTGDEIYITSLSVSENSVGITENLLENSIEVYPNPAINQLKMTLPQNAEVRIFDNIGRMIMSRTSSLEIETFDVSALLPGMYFVHVSYDGQTASRSIIKK